jgi:hypothetical protein
MLVIELGKYTEVSPQFKNAFVAILVIREEISMTPEPQHFEQEYNVAPR